MKLFQVEISEYDAPVGAWHYRLNVSAETAEEAAAKGRERVEMMNLGRMHRVNRVEYKGELL